MDSIIKDIINITNPLGIVGLAVFIFYLLYKALIEKNILTKTSRKSTADIVKLVIKCVLIFSLAAMLIGATTFIIDKWMGSRTVKPEPSLKPEPSPGKLVFKIVKVKNDPDEIIRYLLESEGYPAHDAELNKYFPIIDITVQNVGGAKVLLDRIEYEILNKDILSLLPQTSDNYRLPSGTSERSGSATGALRTPFTYVTFLPKEGVGGTDIVTDIAPDDYCRVILTYGARGELGENPQKKLINLALTVYSDTEPLKYEDPLQVALYYPSSPSRVTLDKAMIDKFLARPDLLVNPIPIPVCK